MPSPATSIKGAVKVVYFYFSGLKAFEPACDSCRAEPALLWTGMGIVNLQTIQHLERCKDHVLKGVILSVASKDLTGMESVGQNITFVTCSNRRLNADESKNSASDGQHDQKNAGSDLLCNAESVLHFWTYIMTQKEVA